MSVKRVPQLEGDEEFFGNQDIEDLGSIPFLYHVVYFNGRCYLLLAGKARSWKIVCY